MSNKIANQLSMCNALLLVDRKFLIKPYHILQKNETLFTDASAKRHAPFVTSAFSVCDMFVPFFASLVYALYGYKKSIKEVQEEQPAP